MDISPLEHLDPIKDVLRRGTVMQDIQSKCSPVRGGGSSRHWHKNIKIVSISWHVKMKVKHFLRPKLRRRAWNNWIYQLVVLFVNWNYCLNEWIGLSLNQWSIYEDNRNEWLISGHGMASYQLWLTSWYLFKQTFELEVSVSVKRQWTRKWIQQSTQFQRW